MYGHLYLYKLDVFISDNGSTEQLDRNYMQILLCQVIIHFHYYQMYSTYLSMWSVKVCIFIQNLRNFSLYNFIFFFPKVLFRMKKSDFSTEW